jgi:predicted RND superfamily exporter protein
MMRLARLVAQHPLLVLVAAAVVTVVAAFPASQVRFQTDLPSLLPSGAPAADDYRVFLDRFGGFEKVFVMIQLAADNQSGTASGAEPATDLVEAAAILTELLSESPEVASVRSGIEPEDERFFVDHVLPRAPLLLGDGWESSVRERITPEAITARVDVLRDTVLSPAGSFRAPLLRADPLGIAEDLAVVGSFSSAVPVDPVTMAFLSLSGDTSLVILEPARGEIDPEGGRALMSELELAYAKVEAELGLELRFYELGGPLYAAQDEAILRRDLSRTVTGSVLGCMIVLIVAFEGLLLPAAALLALAMGLTWTGAWIGLSVSQISAIGVGFAAVLVGLGIDYGIHGGARFRQELLLSGDRTTAMMATFRHSGPGIVTSALTTAAAFSVLGLAHTRPLRELGLVVALGILSILIASATAGAAVVGCAQLRQGKMAKTGALWRLLGATVDQAVGLATRRPRVILVVALVLTLLAAMGLCRLSLDPDLSSLRPAAHPAHAAEQLLADRFALGLDTITVLVPGEDLDQALSGAREVEDLLRESLGSEADITSPAQWLTTQEVVQQRLQDLSLMSLREAADQLKSELDRVGLNPVAFKRGLAALTAFAGGDDPGAPPRSAWPAWLNELVREDENGVWVALRLRLAPGVWPDAPEADLKIRIKRAAPGSAIASAASVGAELRTVAGDDVTRLSLVALVLVMLVVGVSFRGRLLPSILAGVPVILGSIWVLGLWGWLGRSVDLISLAVLPIMLGIGIDDGLHALHGARIDPVRGIRGAVIGAGRAMALTTLTTCIGFGSLTLSQIPGLRNGGLLVAAGVLACLLSTLVVLPALESALRR